MPVEYRKWITREMLKTEPETLFVFGDNMRRKGFGGQAKFMRGEPNAVGIPTKNKPSNDDGAFFCDNDFEKAKIEIDASFQLLANHLKGKGKIVWPADGIGTGRAALPEKAPKIWNYLEARRIELEDI